ncbi:MAG: hypothetical protein LBB88_06925 [Planctomycetaceae bacterium]|jgi:hypothetical protein|nr:hypothetical protein [Planctomycetaceae bacterium]
MSRNFSLSARHSAISSAREIDCSVVAASLSNLILFRLGDHFSMAAFGLTAYSDLNMKYFCTHSRI